MRFYYDDSTNDVNLCCFQTKLKYGFEYIGVVKKLVVTSLTERMHLIYMTALRMSLGGAAIGPAGTGKSESTKDLAMMCGKALILYNCSDYMSSETFTRLLKGMVIIGSWMCFDEFNRFGHQILSVVGEQLSMLFRFRSSQNKKLVDFGRETIMLRPDFQLFISYNPGYSGRKRISTALLNNFRTITMLNTDKKAIYTLLLFCVGFTEGDSLAQILFNFGDIC